MVIQNQLENPDLTEAQDRYASEGYAIFREVIDREMLQEADEHMAWLRQHYPVGGSAEIYSAPVQNDLFWVRLVSDERLLNLVELFLGPNLALFGSNYVNKAPYTGAAVLWHQDGFNWPLEPMQVITLWLAIDDSTPKNGCLRVIPGSHQLPLQPLRERKDVPNVFGWEIDPALVEEASAVDLILKAGDVSVHHPNLIHGSGPNLSLHRRAGLSIRYISTSARITSPFPWPDLLLLRGETKEKK